MTQHDYPYKDKDGFQLIGNTQKRSYTDCTSGKYVVADKLPQEDRWMLNDWMRLTPVEWRIFRDRMREYELQRTADPYGKVTIWEGTQAGYKIGPQNGSIRTSYLAWLKETGNMRDESLAFYNSSYTNWLRQPAIRSARSWTDGNEKDDLNDKQRAAKNQRHEIDVRMAWETVKARSVQRARLVSVNKSTTIVDTNRFQCLFSYETLVAVYERDTTMFYVSVKDRADTDYGNTTRTAINKFLGGKWQDLAKNGKALIYTQQELDALL